MDTDDSQLPQRDRTTRRAFLAALGAATFGGVAAGLSRVFAEPAELDATPAGGPPDRPTTTGVASLPSTTDDRQPEPVGSSTTVRSTTTTTEAMATEIDVLCRDAWGAQAARSGLTPHIPVRLTLHHTAVAQTSLSQGPARARQHQAFHLSMGWPDLAYHLLIDRSGAVYRGRGFEYRGDTATEYDPNGHFLVCLEGDFDQQEPSGIQLSRAIGVFAWASQTFDIDPETLAGHSAYATTTCPGRAIESILAEGALVDGIATAGPHVLRALCGAEGVQAIHEIEAST